LLNCRHKDFNYTVYNYFQKMDCKGICFFCKTNKFTP